MYAEFANGIMSMIMTSIFLQHCDVKLLTTTFWQHTCIRCCHEVSQCDSLTAMDNCLLHDGGISTWCDNNFPKKDQKAFLSMHFYFQLQSIP